jgi:hypothetical protein
MAQISIQASSINPVANNTVRDDTVVNNNLLAKICSLYEKHEKVINLGLTCCGVLTGAGLAAVTGRSLFNWCVKACGKALLKRHLVKLVSGSIKENKIITGNRKPGNRNGGIDLPMGKDNLVSNKKLNPQAQLQPNQSKQLNQSNPGRPSNATAQQKPQSPSPTSSHNSKTLVVSTASQSKPPPKKPSLNLASFDTNLAPKQLVFLNDDYGSLFSPVSLNNNIVNFRRPKQNGQQTGQNWFYSLESTHS